VGGVSGINWLLIDPRVGIAVTAHPVLATIGCDGGKLESLKEQGII
jgi:hypothetical protein